MGLTKPRSRKPVSQATISQLSTATGAWQAGDLSPRSSSHAPDGSSWENYNKGWRFLPTDIVMSPDSKTGDGSPQPIPPYTTHEIYKDQTHVDSDRSKPIKVTSFGLNVLKALKDLHNSNGDNPKAQKVIDDAHYQLIIAPQIKAQEEQLAKQKKAKELEYATLKMRVIELEKRPTAPEPTAPAVTSSLPIIPIIIIAVIVGIFLLRRRA